MNIIIAITTIVIFLIRVKLTYIFYTKTIVGLFVLYKVNIKINGFRHVTVIQITEECRNCKCYSSSPNTFY